MEGGWIPTQRRPEQPGGWSSRLYVGKLGTIETGRCVWGVHQGIECPDHLHSDNNRNVPVPRQHGKMARLAWHGINTAQHGAATATQCQQACPDSRPKGGTTGSRVAHKNQHRGLRKGQRQQQYSLQQARVVVLPIFGDSVPSSNGPPCGSRGGDHTQAEFTHPYVTQGRHFACTASQGQPWAWQFQGLTATLGFVRGDA